MDGLMSISNSAVSIDHARRHRLRLNLFRFSSVMVLACPGILGCVGGATLPWQGAGFAGTNMVPPPPYTSNSVAPQATTYAAPQYATETSNPAVGNSVQQPPNDSVYAPDSLAPIGSAVPAENFRIRYQSPDDQIPGRADRDQGFFVDEALEGEFDHSQLVQEVRIEGNRRVPTPEILRQLKSRAGRYFDPDLLQQDVQALWRMQTIRRVHGPFLDKSKDGIVITFQVEEHPVITELKFVGNRAMTDSYLRRETGLEVGRPLNEFEIRMAKEKIQELYRTKGHTHTTVEILDSDDPSTVVFVIYEDERKVIDGVSFEGNSIATDARLGVIVKSKSRKLWLFGGKLDMQQLERDVDLLRAYYYSLGFFNTKVDRELLSKPGSNSVKVKFVINEGPRYRIRSVRFDGNSKYSDDELLAVLKHKPGTEEQPYFNADSMNEDVEVLRDTYGSVGHIFADVQAQPHFLEEPGLIDLVYKVDEGKAYRVGRVNIHIEGDGITKRKVIIGRMTQKSGDLIDIRRIRQSERLLRSSQLFINPQNPSAGPRIVVRTNDGETVVR